MAEIIEIHTKAAKPEYVIPDALTLSSFEEAKKVFLLHCRAKNLSSRTLPWYDEKLCMLEEFLKNKYPSVLLHQITPHMLKEFICYLQEKDNEKKLGARLSSYTVAGIVRGIKVFFRFLTDEGYLEHNPCQNIKVPKVQKKVIKPLTEEEIVKLLFVHDVKTFLGFRNYLIIFLFLDTGIRLSELVHLKIGDVDMARCTLKVLGKGSKEREVPFGLKVANAFAKYFKWRGTAVTQDFVFVDKFGRELKLRHVEHIVERAAKKAGVEHIHCHRFRHTFALNWIRYGGDVLSLQRILGHATLDMVRNYVHLACDDLVSKHKQFGLMDKLELKAKNV